ncbi:MAG: DUF1638 domain-containing protein [Planctomycetota bacterium]
METEVEYLIERSPNVVRLEKLPQGLHNEPDVLRQRIQALIDQLEGDECCDAIVLVYGLCSGGTQSVRAERCPLVIPRAHDCITLLLGSRQRYAEYVRQHPGTYWYSPGWNRHHTPPGPERYANVHRDYVERFGEDNADYLMQTEQHWFSAYHRATYVHLSIGATDFDRDTTQRCAEWLGWDYDEQAGDPGLLRSLLSGDWDDERFLVLRPGQTLRMTGDESVMTVCDLPSGSAEGGWNKSTP